MNKKYKARIYISLRDGVKNNEGEAIQKSLHNLGYSGVRKFNAGKFMTLELKAKNYKDADDKVTEMCEKLLVNLVIEKYRCCVWEIL